MKLKKLVAAAISVVMITICVQPCFAVTIAEITDFVANPFNLPQMSMRVDARESGQGAYSSSLAVTSETASSVDYKATLDMSTVRDLFDEGFMTVIIPGDPGLQSEYNSAEVSTTVDVVIDYPATANITGDLNSIGYLDAGNIFSEKSRVASGNKLTITYVNRQGLTAQELTANVDTYLKDISFYLEGSVSYETEGSHMVTVTMSGSTQIKFASKTQTVNYYGGASQITNFSKAIVDHVLEIVPLIPATCDTPGQTESVKCATHNSYDCDEIYGVHGIVHPTPIPVLNHEINVGGTSVSMKIEIPEVPATCATTGVRAHKMCALCKQDFDMVSGAEVSHDSLIIPVLNSHTGLETIQGVDATCTKDGLTNGQKCNTCGKITQVQTVIPALGHSLMDVPGFAPTCYSAGISTGKRCQRPGCGLIIVAQEIIPATGHNMGEWVVTTPATENAEGKKERSCLNSCGYKEEVTIPKLVHTHKVDPKMDVITLEPTCTQAGKKQQYCACGLAYGQEVTIPAKGHASQLSHITHIPATCSEEGTLEHYKCPDCNQLFRDAQGKKKLNSAVIPKDKHNHAGGEVIMPSVKATCTTEGLTEGKKCNKCKIIIEKQRKVNRLWNDVTTWVEQAATCEANGVLGHYHCTICNKDFLSVAKDEISSEELVVAAKGHRYGAWSDPYVDSSDNKTYRKRVCRDCDKEDICEVEQAAHEHNETRWEIIKEPTLTETGLKRKVHSCCGEVIEDNVVIPKKEHNLVFVPAQDATCFSTGTSAYWKCLECQSKFSAHDRTQQISAPDELAMLVHKFINKGHYNECKHCGEKVHIVKPNEVEVQIDKHGGIRNDEDRLRENSINTNSDEDHVKIEAEIIIEPLEEVSPEIDEQIRNEITSENTNIEKVAYDITVEKVTTYTNKDDEDREKVVETDDLVTIIITIPQNMRSLVDFTVHRKHEDHTDIIKTTPNAYGEYIEIDKANWKITLHVKRFSEYAVVGYSEIVNDTPIVGGDDDAGPSATNKYTVKFNTNGGTAVNNVMVNHGNKVTEPETTRDGYTLEGWYTDYELTVPYDFNTPVTYGLTLYAKWIKEKGIGSLIIDDESCGGLLDDGCPHLDYDDIDPEMWYHYGIDFVLDNKLMIGVAEKEFAPDLSVTRGMLVTVLYRAEGEPVAPETVSFEDLNVGDYYVDAVKWAAEHGIVLGYSDSVYAPDDVITREQIAAIIHRYAKFKGFDVSVGETTSIESYDDYDRVSEYAIPSLQYAVGSGLINGRTETTLNPREDTTRAEMATILYRFFKENLSTVVLNQETK